VGSAGITERGISEPHRELGKVSTTERTKTRFAGGTESGLFQGGKNKRKKPDKLQTGGKKTGDQPTEKEGTSTKKKQ